MHASLIEAWFAQEYGIGPKVAKAASPEQPPPAASSEHLLDMEPPPATDLSHSAYAQLLSDLIRFAASETQTVEKGGKVVSVRPPSRAPPGNGPNWMLNAPYI